MLCSGNEGTLYLLNYGRPKVNSEVLTKELDSQDFEKSLEILGGDSLSTRSNIGTLDSLTQNLPDSYKSASSGPEFKDFQEASNHELNSFVKLKTWTVGDLPINKKTLRLWWIFAKKSPT